MKATDSKMMPHWETNKQARQRKGKLSTCSTPGMTKGLNCQATQIEKAMAKYPRSIKTCPTEYKAWEEKCKKYSK